jgi:hypothetical protein
VPVTDSVFTGLLKVAKDISSSCALPGSVAAAAVAAAAAAGDSGGGGGGEEGAAPTPAPIVPPTFSTIYLRRDEARGDVTSGADISLSERVVLRVVCVTLPNLAYQRKSGDGESGIQRVPAVVPFR